VVLSCQLKHCYASPRISSEVQDCAFPLSFDQYAVCSWQCKYCFAFNEKSNNPTLRHTVLSEGGLANAVNTKQVKDTFLGKLKNGYQRAFFQWFVKNKIPMQWGGLGDPFDAFERRQKVGLDLIRFFDQISYPIIFSTKGTLCSEDEYLEVFKRNPKNWAFRYTVISLNEEKCKRMEAGAPSPWDRLKSMKKLADAGVYCILRFRPYIIGFSEETDLLLLEEAKRCGAKAISLEFMCYETRANQHIKQRYHDMSQILGFDMNKFFKMGSYSSGGYLRLNRNIKWPYVRKLYAACKKLGLGFYTSDPSYKELSESGCCCGIPYDHETFGNYAKAQYTELIVEARRRALQGDMMELTWEDYSTKGIGLNWGKEINANRFFPVGIDREDRWLNKYLNIYDYLRQRWNNPNRKSSPYKYFEGKLKPIRVDGDNNVVYQYVIGPEDLEAEEIKKSLN